MNKQNGAPRVFLSLTLTFLTFTICVWSPTGLEAGGSVGLDRRTRDLPLLDGVEVLSDPSGRLSFGDVSSRRYQESVSAAGVPLGKFKPTGNDPVFVHDFRGIPNLGFRPGVHWLRFEARSETAEVHTWWLEVAYPHLDRVTLFRLGSPQPVATTGRNMRFAERPIPHHHFLLPLTLAARGTATFYLRVQTEGSVQVPMYLHEPSLFSTADSTVQYVNGIYLGILLIMIVFNVFLFLGLRETDYLFYTLFLIGFTAWILSITGHSYRYLFPESPEIGRRSLPLTGGFYAAFLTLFSIRFLHTAQKHRFLHRAFQVIASLSAALVVATFLLPYSITIRWGSALMLLIPPIILAAGINSWVRGFGPARYMVIGWSVFLVAVVVYALKTAGLIPPSVLTEYAMQTGSVATVAFLSFALADRFNVLRREKESAQEEALRNQDQAIRNLEHADRMKDEFLANTSHELRTPLNGIIGLATFIQSVIEGSARVSRRTLRDNVSMIVSSSRRLSSLVNDILDFSKMKNSDLELRFTAVDLHAAASLAMHLSAPMAAHKRLDLRVEIPPGLPPVRADEDRLQQILLNLVNNAVKFTHEGSVTVRAALESEAEGAPVVIAVSDTGVGIPKDKQAVIFDSFQQGDGSVQREYGGTGLGLSIVRSLLRLHDSEIVVESEPGVGSSFSFVLPQAGPGLKVAAPTPDESTIVAGALNVALAPAPVLPERVLDGDVVPRDQAALAVTRAVPGTPQEQVTVLVVDDEPINLKVLENHLQAHGYRVVTAADGEQAMERLRTFRPDVILLDLMMPRMSGLEVCRRIRETHPATLLPIIFLSAKNQVQDLVTGLESGANDYVTKPFSHQELLARLSVHMDLRNTLRSQMRLTQQIHRFVPQEFLELMDKTDVSTVEVGDSARMRMTVLFSDIRRFTSLTETMTEEEAFRFLNSYLRRMEPEIRRHGGFVDKFIGDAVMALFADRRNGEASSAELALRAALGMRHALVLYNQHRKNNNYPEVDFGIGLNTGDLMLGTVGSANRLDTTVVGDTVNAASRLEALTAYYGAPVLLGEQTVRDLTPESARLVREIDIVQLKGRVQEFRLFEAFGADGPELAERKLATRADFELAVGRFRAGRLSEADAAFAELKAGSPEDRVVAFYRDRASTALLGASGAAVTHAG